MLLDLLLIASGALSAFALVRVLAWARRRGDAVSEANGEAVTLGGLRYVTVEHRSSEWDAYAMAALGRVGLVPLPAMEQGETGGAYGLRILMALLKENGIAPVLGCFLMPATLGAKGWTPAAASHTARHVASLTAPEDRKKIHNLTVSVLLDFFANGTASSLISLDSSPGAPREAGPSEAMPRAGAASGPPSVPSWLMETPTAPAQ